MKLRNFIYPSYQFVYRIMDITIFNQTEVIDEELKLAQASMPNKARLCASAGFSPTAMLGNTIIENKIFKDILDMWMPLKSSYTTSNDGSDEGGRPTKSETEISEVTQNTHDNDGNDPDNRV